MLDSEHAVRQIIDGCHPRNTQQYLISRWIIKANQKFVSIALLFQYFNRAIKYQFTFVDDLHMVTDHFNFRQDMGRKNHAMLTAKLFDQGTNITNLDWI